MFQVLVPLVLALLSTITTAQNHPKSTFIKLDEIRQATVESRAPAWFQFKNEYFPEDCTAVIIRLMLNSTKNTNTGSELEKPSRDNNCVIVSVQNETTQETILKDEENVRFRGLWHTMSSRGAVTIQRSAYPNGFHIVLVPDTSETTCKGNTWRADAISKTIQVVISDAMPIHVYRTNWILPVVISVLIIVVTIVCGWVMSQWLDKRKHLYAPPSEWDCSKSCTKQIRGCCTPAIPLYVSRLLTRSSNRIDKRTKLYLGTVVPVGVYYTLPTIQLVIMYLYHTNETGNLDICYYNFECAYPSKVLWWVIKDFNHVLSNVGYICAGISAFAWVRLVSPKLLKYGENSTGIPPHSGLNYAIAFAITVEGVLSACYHVCPNRSNFHHDTCFMYICITLTGLKLYQARHPQSSVSGPTTFVLLGILMFLDLLGEKFEYQWFFWVFSLMYILAFVWMAAQMYYLGKAWLKLKETFTKQKPAERSNIPDEVRSLDTVTPEEDIVTPEEDIVTPEEDIVGPEKDIVTPEEDIVTATRDVIVWIILAFVLNFGVVLYFYFGVFRPALSTQTTFDFGSYILKILGANMAFYFVYYLYMKWLHKEEFSWMFWILFIPALVLWGWGWSYFIDNLTAWERPAPHSRELNRACTFYDEHDFWHFLSAAALFLTFLSLEFLDINLLDAPRDKIPVF